MEQTVEILTISFAGEIIEMPVIRTQENIRQVVNPKVQHVVGTDDVENHIVQPDDQTRPTCESRGEDSRRTFRHARSSGLAHSSNPEVWR